MRTRYGLSPWVENLPSSRRPDFLRLRGEHVADVVIIGGGLTGCATAYSCAVAGLKPLLIEAGRVGQGSAGRSGGLLLPDPGPGFRDIAARHGLRAARRVFEAWRRASLDAAAELRRLRVPCGLERREVLSVAWRDDEQVLRKEHEARDEAGLPVRWLSPKDAARTSVLDAATSRLGDAFALDPYRATVGLAAAAVKRGAGFFERSAVTAVKAGDKSVEVTVDGGVVRARTVIVTTGSATAEFTPLRRHFKRRETYLVLTEPLTAAMRKAIVASDFVLRDTHAHRLRRTRDDRLVIEGADQGEVPARARDAVRIQRTGQLMYELLLMYPVISGLQPEYGWESAYGETPDGLMYIGPHRNYPRHLFALGGQRSLTGSFLAARLLTRAALGRPERGDEVFGWAR